ncbi:MULTISPECIES: hypothetical protein [unclassified Streptomyces]|uniref:hypothetical protein n=1 Tax=unclassified Streptomyces TaxID=2593676 RepID=UPI002250A837|nr:hypothetical protein [Streptomyces sp. NBC_00047]MCX5613520.1 hypothetical protein [Streptomyces sp. NBC_00047]
MTNTRTLLTSVALAVGAFALTAVPAHADDSLVSSGVANEVGRLGQAVPAGDGVEADEAGPAFVARSVVGRVERGIARIQEEVEIVGLRDTQ